MPSGSIFPSLPGLSWSTFKEPQFKTRIQRGVSGRELRLTFQPVPTWLFTLSFEFLRDTNDMRGGFALGAGYQELRTLMQFFLAQQGSLTPFVFNDPTDNSVINQYIGTGDGTTTTFQLIRTLTIAASNQFNEPILAPNIVSNVYVNGNQISAGAFSVNYSTGVLTFGTPPANGNIITADFTYYFLVRFSDDSLKFENFFIQLWSTKELKLQSILI